MCYYERHFRTLLHKPHSQKDVISVPILKLLLVKKTIVVISAFENETTKHL